MTCIWEVPGLNFGWETIFIVVVILLGLSRWMPRWCLEIGPDSFPIIPFMFNDYDYPVTLTNATYCWSSQNIVKWHTVSQSNVLNCLYGILKCNFLSWPEKSSLLFVLTRLQAASPLPILWLCLASLPGLILLLTLSKPSTSEDGGNMLHWNTGIQPEDCTVQQS